MDERGGLENRCSLFGYRGFESLPLRFLGENIFRFGIFCFGMYISIEMTKRKKSIYADDYREIILKLITFRKKAGLTQNDVAKLLSSSQSYISKIENCQIRIDLIQLKQFANIYQVKIQNLIE